MRRIINMDRPIKWVSNRWLLALTTALLLYTLIGFSLIPFLVQHYTPRLAADWLKRRAAVGEAQFNPYSFTLEIKNLAFNEADGRPILAFKRLFLDFEPSQFLTRRTWVLADLQLDGPSAHLVLDAVGQLNLAKIADSLPKSEEPPSSTAEEPSPRFLLSHFTLTEGAVKFTDLGKSPPINETVEHLNLELNGISTLPDREGDYEFKAGLADGSQLAWRGDVSLNPVASKGELRIEAFRLATLWNFVKDRLDLAEPGGAINLAARYQFSHAKDKTELSVEHGAFKLSGLRLMPAKAKEPILTLEEIGFDQASLDLSGQAIRIPAFAIRKGTVNASVDQAGQINWLTLVKPEPTGKTAQAIPPPPKPAPPSQPWKVALEKFEIAELKLNYSDASRKSPFAVSVGDFGLKLGAEVEAGSNLPKARVDQLDAHLNQVALARPGNTTPLFGWDSLAVDGGRFDLEKREATLKTVSLKGGGTAIVREADGALRPFDIFAPREEPAGTAPSGGDQPTTPEPSENQPWRFALDQFSLQDFGVALADRSLSPELAYQLDDIRVTANHLSNDGKTPVAFDAKLTVRQGGALQASGTAAPTGEAAQAKVKADRINLTPLQPIINQFAALKLDSGTLSSDLDVNFRQGQPNPSLQVTGGASLDNLSLHQSKDGKRFLAWKSLTVNTLKFGLAPDGLSIREARIVEPDTVIAIAKDYSTNLAAVFKPQKPEPHPAKAPAPPGKSKAPAQPFPVSVERVRIDKGQMDFSDMSLVLPFATHIHDLDGAAASISLAPKDRATLKFAGRVDEYGGVKVDGTLSPMQIKDFSNIDVVFRNIAMSSLSPYSATFAGRAIESGKLNLDLAYKIENSRLKSQNKIVLDHFTLGEKVESPNALDLPLDLAIALLTDSEGKIQAAVPIEGDIDNPQFDYGAVVWDAVVNLVKKIVTAPFAAIAGAFGGSDEKLDAVLFEPAKDTIPPPEREKLHKLAEALTQRPKLGLTVHGGFNPKLDGSALKSLEVRRELARKMGVALSPGEEPDEVSFGNAAAERALEKLAAERGGGIAAGTEADYLRKTGQPPQRIGALAGLVGRASDTPEFYEQLFNKLVETTPLPESQLEALAKRRALAVIGELTDKERLDKARISTGKIEATEDSADGKAPVKLELIAE